MAKFIRIMLIIAISGIAVAALVWLISKKVSNNSPYATRFGALVSKLEDFDIYVLIIKGCEKMWEGDYHIIFRLADGTEITLTDTEMNRNNKWFVKYFTRKERGHGFIITSCCKGKHLLIIDIINEYIEQTLYIPFEIEEDQQYIL